MSAGPAPTPGVEIVVGMPLGVDTPGRPAQNSAGARQVEERAPARPRRRAQERAIRAGKRRHAGVDRRGLCRRSTRQASDEANATARLPTPRDSHRPPGGSVESPLPAPAKPIF